MFCTRLRKDLLLVARRVTLLITGRNEVVAKVMFLLMSVILSTGGGLCLSACWDTATPTRRRHPCGQGEPPKEAHPHQGEPPLPRRPPREGGTPLPRRPPQKETPLPRRPPPRRKHPPAKETPQEGGPPPGPHPRGKLRGIRSRPTPKGEIEGDQIQGPHPRGKLRGIRSKAPPYGQWAASTHPTGMHSCLKLVIP